MLHSSRFIRTVSSSARVGAIVVVVVGLARALGACSDQAEGERCSLQGDNGGNDECQSGLTCQDKGGNTPVCCPANGGASTVACGVPPTPTGGDASFTEAAAPDSSPGIDAGNDTGADAPVEAAADAPADGG